MWQSGLQSALGITKCGRVDYKGRQGLQSVVGLQNELVQLTPKIRFRMLMLCPMSIGPSSLESVGEGVVYFCHSP